MVRENPIHSDEGLRLETSALESLYDGPANYLTTNLTLKPNILHVNVCLNAI